MAYYTTTDDGEGLQLSNKQLVAAWAQQSGASHEDWEHDGSSTVCGSSRFGLGSNKRQSRAPGDLRSGPLGGARHPA